MDLLSRHSEQFLNSSLTNLVRVFISVVPVKSWSAIPLLRIYPCIYDLSELKVSLNRVVISDKVMKHDPEDLHDRQVGMVVKSPEPH